MTLMVATALTVLRAAGVLPAHADVVVRPDDQRPGTATDLAPI